MKDCIFCKIVNREIPAHIVYENKDFLAFLDINPKSPGHCQVIPKKHYRWVWDVPNIGEYSKVVQKIARALQKAFKTEWILSKTIGDEVEHAHIWVYPAWAGVTPNSEVEGDLKDFEGNAKKIIKELK